MNAIALPFYRRPLACNYRPLIMAVTAVTLFGAFWLLSRYPQLFDKARHVTKSNLTARWTGNSRQPLWAMAWWELLAMDIRTREG